MQTMTFLGILAKEKSSRNWPENLMACSICFLFSVTPLYMCKVLIGTKIYRQIYRDASRSEHVGTL